MGKTNRKKHKKPRRTKRKLTKKEAPIYNGYPTSKKNKIAIPVHDIVRFLTLPQPIAAKQLKISTSTLKRRYYELNIGQRWPANQLDAVSLEECASKYEKERNLEPKEKAKLSHITNLYN